MISKAQFIAVVVASGTVMLASIMLPISAAAQWAEVGTPSRPAWVNTSAERRLRLLPALPAIVTTLQGQVAGYFGSKGPGMTVGLVLDDGLFFSQGFGFRDEALQHKPDETTVYRVGSLTKVVTAATLLTLVDKGKVSMDDAAVKYVPEVQNVRTSDETAGSTCAETCNIDEGKCMQQAHSVSDRKGCIADKKQCTASCPKPVVANKPILLRHLVSHTSGLPNQMNPPEADESTWFTELQSTKLAFWPGSFSAYSGVGVELEALIIKRVSGKSFEEYMKENLLDPLRMSNSHLKHDDVPADLLAQKYKYSWPAGQAAPTFAIDKNWDNPQMLIPAGNLFTNVADFSHFIMMELTGYPRGKVLKKKTVLASQTSAVPSSGMTPSCVAFTDNQGVSYSGCGDAAAFGFGWSLNAPYVEHNGSFGNEWGSQTRVHVGKLMGATGLISTEPYPAAPSGSTPPNNISDVINGLLNAGIAADSATTWAKQTLPVGVARVLYLSGKTPDQNDFDAFTPQFVADHSLTKTNVVSFLQGWQKQVGRCGTFRVREVETASTITARFSCEKGEWGAVLDVEQASPHRIAWSDEVTKSVTPPGLACTATCSIQEGSCMQQAHSSSERQQCIAEKKQCAAACNTNGPKQ
jgi:CubicO group peptidase (beta-lactamase class C family)